MFGPPCNKCGSETNWLPDKDGEKCSCGWPEEEVKPKTGFIVLSIFLILFGFLFACFIKEYPKGVKEDRECLLLYKTQENKKYGSEYYFILESEGKKFSLMVDRIDYFEYNPGNILTYNLNHYQVTGEVSLNSRIMLALVWLLVVSTVVGLIVIAFLSERK